MDDATLTRLIAAWLAAAGVGAWRPTGPTYTTGEVGIFYGPIAEIPDRAIGVTVYSSTDPVSTGTTVRYVQVRYRGAPGAPAGADTLASAGFAALHGVHRRGGVARARRISSARLGADDTGRQERTDNYEFILNPPPLEA
ncbi:hypothetical protein CWIS_13580 [Cellulomonas sp. A375-1]|uniref:minor capsid protein n=1 Tax=Cellulomonas sp. A375-1 TaxID=1672219 RepID=UPI0006527DC9|nr:minor capsid protein [Cellulomonas sp. A375-1]KMM44860.1 hypothetical protein CWIS_13580 [Cellulomonas sp. A375-1]